MMEDVSEKGSDNELFNKDSENEQSAEEQHEETN